MKAKTFLGIMFLFLTGFLALPAGAFVEKTKQQKYKDVIAKIYSETVACKNKVVSFTKNHPFIAATIAVALMSKKMRSTLMSLPHILWDESQNHPVMMALLGGFVLSYMVT